MAKFSFVIPSLNEEVNLPVLLSSLASQTVKDFEVVVSDGKSEDKTKEEALKFKDKLMLKFVESPKRKLTFQRNFGAKNAEGEYLIFLDSDYKTEEGFLKKISDTLKKTNADVIIPVSMPVTKDIFWKTYYWITNKIAFTTLILGQPFTVASAICVRKELFDKIGGYDDSIFVYEDQYLFRQTFKLKAKIAYSKAKLYFSLRRNEKVGKIKFIYENLIATLHLIFKGPIKKEIYKYEMGGQEFEK